MSNALWPMLTGLTWDVKRTPQWQTRVQRSVGGKEMRAAFYASPIWSYKLSYEVLRDGAALGELQTIQAFFLQRQGSFDSFLYSDPNDNAVTAHGFGVGDGTTTAFQLQRSYLGVNQQDYWSGLKTSQYTVPRTNLLLYSEDFTNAAWTKTTCTVTSNAALAPDGTVTADQLTSTVAGGRVTQTVTAVVSGSHTLSAWAQAGATSIQRLIIYNSTTAAVIGQADFNLSTGAITGVTGSAVAVKGSNGQWRCVLTSTSGITAGNSLVGYVYAGQGNLSESTYVGKTQFETGSAATPYIGPTTSATVTATPLYWPKTGDAFEPVYNLNPATPLQVYRSDWQGNQLMYSTARTNLALQSQTLTTAPWTNLGVTVAASGTAPDGSASSWKVAEDTSAGQHQLYQTVAYAAGYIVVSCDVKPVERTWARLQTASGVAAYFNLATGALGSSPGGSVVSITPLPNGWYRVSLSTSVSAGSSYPSVGPTTGDTISSYTGTAGSGILATNFQVVQVPAASLPTPYIPTTTAAVTVTDYSVNSAGLVTFANAPLSGAVLTWTGAYYWRVRFAQDVAEFNNFMQGLWDLKQVDLVTVK